jgi:hypothetical protein
MADEFTRGEMLKKTPEVTKIPLRVRFHIFARYSARSQLLVSVSTAAATATAVAASTATTAAAAKAAS